MTTQYSIELLYDCLPNHCPVTPHLVCSQFCTVNVAMTNFESIFEIFSLDKLLHCFPKNLCKLTI